MITSYKDLDFKRLSGNSNAVYKVDLGSHIEVESKKTPRTLLYRRYEQTVTEKHVEQAIFKGKSEDKSGPNLYF